jgi:hypothetical protein
MTTTAMPDTLPTPNHQRHDGSPARSGWRSRP